MEIGNKIAELRKLEKMTQEGLAAKLGISNQSVSKWESNQCCPDIQFLPQLADIFGITIDELFGRKQSVDENTDETFSGENIGKSDLPWEDDGKLYVVVYEGHKLLGKGNRVEEYKDMSIVLNGTSCGIDSYLSVECNGSISGDVTSGTYVECQDIAGDVTSGTYIECQDIAGNVTSGTYAECQDVAGDVTAGGYVECKEINGDVQAGGYVECEEINGDVQAAAYIECENISGENISAMTYIECENIEGNAYAPRIEYCN